MPVRTTLAKLLMDLCNQAPNYTDTILPNGVEQRRIPIGGRRRMHRDSTGHRAAWTGLPCRAPRTLPGRAGLYQAGVSG